MASMKKGMKFLIGITRLFPLSRMYSFERCMISQRSPLVAGEPQWPSNKTDVMCAKEKFVFVVLCVIETWVHPPLWIFWWFSVYSPVPAVAMSSRCDYVAFKPHVSQLARFPATNEATHCFSSFIICAFETVRLSRWFLDDSIRIYQWWLLWLPR